MKRRILALIGTVMLTLTAPAFAASNVQDAQVTHVQVRTNDLAVIILDKSSSGAPSCATWGGPNGQGTGFTVDVTTDHGKEMVKLANASLLAGRTVSVQGTGDCPHASNKEGLALFLME